MKKLLYTLLFFILFSSEGFSQSKFYVKSNKPTFNVDENACRISEYLYEYQISHESGIFDVPLDQVDIRLFFREGYNDDPSMGCGGPCGQFAWVCEPEINKTLNPFETFVNNYTGPDVITCETRCNEFPISYSSVLIPKMNLLNSTVCPEEKLFDSYNNQTYDLSNVDAYWFYFDGSSWQKIPNYTSTFPLNKSIEEIFGIDYTNYISSSLQLKYVILSDLNYSEIYNPISITNCSPNLVQDPPTAIAPLCSDTDDGSVVVKFDRALASNERMLIYVEYQLPDSSWDWYHSAPILTAADIHAGTNNTYTWNSVLAPNKYRLRYVSKYDSTGSIPMNPNSDEQSLPFSIIAPEPVYFTYSKTDVLCKGDNNGTITFDTANGGTNNGYAYSIDNGANWQSANTFTALAPATYNLTAKDSNGCIAETTASINLAEPLETLSLTPVIVKDPTANGAANGEISISFHGGTAPINYQWTKDGVAHATTQNIVNLGPGKYTVTATDANTCTASLEFQLQEPPPLQITFSAQEIPCNGDTANITAQGQGGFLATNDDYDYLWNNNATEQTLFNVTAGTYTVTITDSNGVTATSSFSLTEPEALAITLNASNVSCSGGTDGTVDLSISGGTAPFHVNWSDDNNIHTEDRTNLPKGEYFYTITDANNCTTNGSVVMDEPAPLVIQLENKKGPTTAGGTDGWIDISVSEGTPPYTYQWTDDTGAEIATSEDISALGDGWYTITVTDANYNLSTDKTGCSTSLTIQLTEPQPLSATISETNPVSCTGGSDGELTANPLGGIQIPAVGYTYQWLQEINGNYELLNVTTQIITGLSVGKYRVIVSDNVGEQTQADYILNQPSVLEIAFTKQDIHCFEGSDGAIDITVSGGTAPYTFSWKDSATNEISTLEDLSDVISGSYTIVVMDNRGCTTEQTMELTSPENALMIILEQLHDPSGASLNDGSIDITVTGGSAPYTFEWMDDMGTYISNTEDLINAGEGIYTLTVHDNNANSSSDNSGCIISEDFVLLAPDPIQITIMESTPLLCNGDANGQLNTEVTGGFIDNSSVYTYVWFKEDLGTFTEIDQFTAEATNLTAGIYQLKVTDDNDVSQTATYTLNQPEPIDISLTVTQTVSCDNGADGAISSLVTGGTPPYSYLWSNGLTSNDITDLPTGVYRLTITDNNGCVFSEDIEIIQPGGMSIDSSIMAPSCYGGSDGSISISVSGGSPDYTYLWNTGEMKATIENLSAGTYSVDITDNEGCRSTQQFKMENPDPLVVDLGMDQVLCSGQTHELDLTINDLGASYQWTSTNGFISASPSVVLTEEGEYFLTITNSNGCTASDSMVIRTTEELISAEFLIPTQAFVGETIVAVDVSDPVPDSVSWIFSEGTTIVSENGDYAELKFEEEGVYTITMISQKGSCEETLTKKIIVQHGTDFGTDQNNTASFIKEFKVFPNPNNGNFKAEVKLQQEASVSIKIINLSSNIITSTRTGEGQENYIFNYRMNTSLGVYLVILETPKGSQIRKIIVG